MRPLALWTVPASAVGMAPATKLQSQHILCKPYDQLSTNFKSHEPSIVGCALDFPDGFGSDIAILLTYEDCRKRPSRAKAIASSTSSQSHYQSPS